MIDWKLHLIFNLLFVITLLGFFYFIEFRISMQEIAAIVVLSSFASLFPDVDMQKSKIRDFVSLAAAAVVAVTYLLNYAQTWYYTPIYFLLLYFIFRYLPTKHRGAAHTFKFSVFFSALIALICYLTFGATTDKMVFYFVVSFLGYNLHLTLDRI